MTASERNLWRMAELAVKNNNVDEVFKDIMEKCDLKTLQLFMLYVGLNLKFTEAEKTAKHTSGLKVRDIYTRSLDLSRTMKQTGVIRKLV